MQLFSPPSIALIGASDEPAKLGHIILRNLIEGGFRGRIVPINPKHASILGLPCFPTIDATPDDIACAVIVTPATTVPAIAEACGQKGVQTLIVISSGFSETGTAEGKEREVALQAIGSTYGMRIIGPNCLGVLNLHHAMNASFASMPSVRGSVGLISQSGAMAVALLDRSSTVGIGFSTVVSIGNTVDVDACDALEALANDDHTHVIGLYLESVRDGRRFMETAKRITPRKPIVLIKAGVSAAGAKAVASHTGALAGSDAALDAACHRAGIRRASTMEEFLEMLAVLSVAPPLLSRRIAIITNAGGPGVLATDAAAARQMSLPALAPSTVATLRAALPASASTANPVDVLGDALADRYIAALDACARDPSIDGIAVLLTPQVMTPCDDVASAVLACKERFPLMPIVAAFMGGGTVAAARTRLQDGNVPTVQSPERAIAALDTLALPPRLRTSLPKKMRTLSSRVQTIVRGQKGLLPEEKAAKLLSLYGIPTPRQSLVRSATEAAKATRAIGLPVIAKISSPDILHKTDCGCVRINLKTIGAVQAAYREIRANAAANAPHAAVRGVLIQRFLPIGNEFIIGGMRDPRYGPLIMVGLGGIYTELLRDTVFRLAPVSMDEAYDMLSHLQAWRLLQGMRGHKPLAIDALATTVHQISLLLHACPTIDAIDMNPVLIDERQVIVADAKIILGQDN